MIDPILDAEKVAPHFTLPENPRCRHAVLLIVSDHHYGLIIAVWKWDRNLWLIRVVCP